jgi:hypothetical protein
MRQSRIQISSSEDSIQRGITKYLRTVLPSGWIVCAIPNGGSRNLIEAAKMKATGTLAGMPDLMILGCNDQGPTTHFLEVKSAKGRPSLPQLNMHDKLLDLQHEVAICRSIDGARDACRRWGLPLKEAA